MKSENVSSLFEAWERCNVMVLSWITRTLAPKIAESIVYINDAKILWDNLRESFLRVIILEF